MMFIQLVHATWSGCTARCRRAGVVSALIVAVLGCSSSAAWAQFTFLPEQISTPELTRYMERLGLSVQQQMAVEAMHDEYKLAFRSLQDGDIRKLNERSDLLMGSDMPERREFERFLNEVDRVHGRIRALDEQLFDQLQPMLTDEQLARLPRVRLARERHRFASNELMWMMAMGQQPPDLSAMIADLDLSAEDRAAVDPVIAEYERRFTRTLAQLSRRSTRMMLDVLDAMEAAGFDEEVASDPERQAELMVTVQQIYMEITEESRKLVNQLRDHNKRTYQMVQPMLSDLSGRDLRIAYYRGAYQELSFAFHGVDYAESRIAAALPDLGPETWDEVRARILPHVDDLDRLIESAVVEVDQLQRTRSPFSWESSDWRSQQEMLQEFVNKWQELQQQVQLAAADIFSPEQRQAIMELAMGSQQAQMPGIETPAVTTEDAVVTVDETMTWGPDQFLAREINSSDLRLYASIMQLDEAQQAILGELHRVYMDQYKEYQRGPLRAVHEAGQQMWMYDEATGEHRRPTRESYQAQYDKRSEAFRALERIDEAFFGDMRLALGNEVPAQLQQRVRLMRSRGRCIPGLATWSYTTRSSMVDLVTLVSRFRLTDAMRAQVEEALHSYETAMTPFLKRAYDANFKYRNEQDLLNVRMWEAQEEGNMMSFDWQEHRRTLQKPAQDVQRLVDEIVALNESTLEKLLNQLQDDYQHRLQESYRRVAYPAVYNDAYAAHRPIARAMELDSLSPDQRTTLEEAALDYRASYDALSRELEALHKELPNATGYIDPEQQQKRQRVQENMERVTFDRNELNSRAVRRLRMTLTPDQIEQIGGLPIMRE